MKLRQNGFAFIELVMVVAFVGVLGFVVITAVNNRNNVASTDTTQASVEPAPQITSKADLATAEASLNTAAIDDNSADADLLDQDLSTF